MYITNCTYNIAPYAILDSQNGIMGFIARARGEFSISGGIEDDPLQPVGDVPLIPIVASYDQPPFSLPFIQDDPENDGDDGSDKKWDDFFADDEDDPLFTAGADSDEVYDTPYRDYGPDLTDEEIADQY